MSITSSRELVWEWTMSPDSALKLPLITVLDWTNQSASPKVVQPEGIAPPSKLPWKGGSPVKSGMPSPSLSSHAVPLYGKASFSSSTLSPSSSGSDESPSPSPSVSVQSEPSFGRSSSSSGQPSLSSSVSALSPMPSPSASVVSLASSGKPSL